MRLRTTGSLLALALALVIPLATSAATVTMSAGTELNATVDQTIDSHSAQVGDVFTAHVQAPYPQDNQALAGAVIRGHITRVQHAGQGVKPEVDLNFDYLTLADGTSGPIDAAVVASQPKTTVKSGARVATFALGGMLLGNAIAKTVFGSGAKHGGTAGALGGILVGANYKADFTFPQGSQMTVRMRHTVAIRRQAGH